MKIIECPRDAMQGLEDFIPTDHKISYINQLLTIGFDTIDFGSFVSHKTIPQMKDTATVLSKLETTASTTKLLAIVANIRGALQAAELGGVHYLGFPLSLSETFQKNNTNKTIAEALVTVEGIQDLCLSSDMQLVTYLSMGFGNPYNDPYNEEIVGVFVERLVGLGINIISLADTIGVSNPQNIKYLFETLIPSFPTVEFGAHLHSHPTTVNQKIIAAYNAGCRRFDGALKGYGGCPMADDQLVGNVATELLLSCLEQLGENLYYERGALEKAMVMVSEIFTDKV